jgi:hypothetical protein
MNEQTLHHGTTVKRAKNLLNNPPNPHFVEPGGSPYEPAGGFSMAPTSASGCMVGTAEQYARNKAKLFPNEGGAAILEIEVPSQIVERVYSHPDLGPAAESGDIRFEPGVGLEELIAAWPTLTKRITIL